MKKSLMVRTGNQTKNLDLVFGAVSDPTRRSMLDRLRGGELTVTELARPYPMSLNAVSKHIKTLERAGLISRSIKGREHFCRLERSTLDEAINWMSYYSEFWRGRMDSLKKHLMNNRRRGTQ